MNNVLSVVQMLSTTCLVSISVMFVHENKFDNEVMKYCVKVGTRIRHIMSSVSTSKFWMNHKLVEFKFSIILHGNTLSHIKYCVHHVHKGPRCPSSFYQAKTCAEVMNSLNFLWFVMNVLVASRLHNQNEFYRVFTRFWGGSLAWSWVYT